MPLKRIEFPVEQGTISPSHWCISDVQNGRFVYYPVRLSEPMVRDTLYQIDAYGLTPYCRVNFGISGEKALEEYYKITNMFMVNNALMVSYNHRRESGTFYYDRSTGVKFNLPYGFKDDFWATGNVVPKPLDPMNGLLYYTREAYEVCDVFNSLNEDDNPVVFILKVL